MESGGIMLVAEETLTEETHAVEDSQADNRKHTDHRSDPSKGKKFHRPEWQKRSPIYDAFYRYGGYYS